MSQPVPGETEKSPYCEMADKYKVQVDFRPFIKIEGVSAKEFRLTKIEVAAHGAVFLTSKTAVDHFFRICNEMRTPVPDTMKYFCLSESIANYLQKYIVYRKRKIFFGANVDELLDLMYKHRNVQILLPLSDPHKPEIPQMLEKRNYIFTKVILYRTVSSDLSDVEISENDILAIYTPAEIKSLFHNFPKFEQGETKIACFGPTTIKAAKAARLRVDIQAPRPNTPSLAMAIDNHLKDLARKSKIKANAK